MTTNLPLKLHSLPNSLPIEGAVRIELVEGVPILRASNRFMKYRIEIYSVAEALVRITNA